MGKRHLRRSPGSHLRDSWRPASRAGWAGVFSAGEVKNTYGTGCFLLMNTGERLVLRISGCSLRLPTNLAAEPCTTPSKWSRHLGRAGAMASRQSRAHSKSSDVEALARTVNDNGGVYFVPAFSGLYAPYWKENARGVIAGLTRYANKGHIARAVLEATAFQTREVVEAMEKDSKSGWRACAWMGDGSQRIADAISADILNREVVRPVIQETTRSEQRTPRGWLSSFSRVGRIARQLGRRSHLEAESGEVEREQLYKQWKKAIARSFDWIES